MNRGVRWRWLMALGATLWLAGMLRASLQLLAEERSEGTPRIAVAIRLLPRMQPSPGVAVFLEFEGRHVEGLRGLAMAPETETTKGVLAVKHLLVKDALGVVRVMHNASTGALTFRRPVHGQHLRVSYLVASPEDVGIHDVIVDDSGVRALGYSLLALPPVAAVLEVSLAWDDHAVPVREAASSFGTGMAQRFEATPSEMAHAFYLAGPLEVHRAEGGQVLVVWGEPEFDAKVALDFYGQAMRAAQQAFEPLAGSPKHTFFLFAEDRLGRRHRGLAFEHSFGVWWDRTRTLDERFKLVVAHEIVHRWIGGHLRLVNDDGSDASWFSEGLSVHYARTVLFRAGLLSSEAFLADVGRDLRAQREAIRFDMQAPGPDKRRARALAAKSHASPAYHRGALYAARIEGLLRRDGRGTLDDIVNQLLLQVPSAQEGLPVVSWRQLLSDALGPAADGELARLMRNHRRPITLPDGALGPCFEAASDEAVVERRSPGRRWTAVQTSACQEWLFDAPSAQ